MGVEKVLRIRTLTLKNNCLSTLQCLLINRLRIVLRKNLSPSESCMSDVTGIEVSNLYCGINVIVH